MTVKAKCRNILRYDKEAGNYVYCDCVVTAEDSQIGTTVECPDCGGSVEVLPPEPQQIEPDPMELLDDVVGESTPTQWDYEPAPETQAKFVRTQIPCINCHARIPISARLCPECGYEQPDDQEPGPTGFQRWVGSWLSDDASPMLIIGIGCAFLFVFGSICLSYTVIQHGTAPALCMLSPFALLLVGAAIIFLASRRPGESPVVAAKRVFDPMSAILILCRASSWREPRWPFRARRVLDRRNSPLSDQNLLDDDDLDRYEALDLEGTQVTDAGLDYLVSAKALKFVVLRRTQTTQKGVRRLQNRRPNVWIWS